MKKLALAIAAAAALAFTAPAPAFAQDVKVKIKSGEHGNVHKKVVIHHGDRGHVSRKVVLHGDRGWSHSNHYGARKTVIIKKHGQGATVIKKKTVIR